jgi:hypothetical protein
MNRSYSKIRHIQESNQRLENRLISEQNPKTVAKTTTAGINSVPQPIKIKVWPTDKDVSIYVESYRLNLYNLRLKNNQIVFDYTVAGSIENKPSSIGQINSKGIGSFYCGQGYRIFIKNLKGVNISLYLSKKGRDLLNLRSEKKCNAYASIDNSSVDNIVEPTDYT